jgi:hypothetical protein
MGSLYSKVTHVANAYDKDIWAHVGDDQWYMKSASYQDTVGNITPGVDIKFEWDKVDTSGYTKIAPKSFLPFQQDSDTVYISIISEDGIICENYHRKMNECYSRGRWLCESYTNGDNMDRYWRRGTR